MILGDMFCLQEELENLKTYVYYEEIFFIQKPNFLVFKYVKFWPVIV